MPVVNRSSPPLSQGVGSSSSLTCTHRMGLAEPDLPAFSLMSRPGIWTRSPTVSATTGLYGSYKGPVKGGRRVDRRIDRLAGAYKGPWAFVPQRRLTGL